MTIVFFLPVILRDSHRRIFPLEQLENDGYKVIILDATGFFGKYIRTTTDEFLLNHTIECQTKTDFLNFKNSLPNNSVLYVTNSSYMRSAKTVLNLIIRKKDKLLVATTRQFSGLHNYPTGIRKFAEDFITKTDNFFPWYYWKFYYKIFRKNYIPDFFLGSTQFLLPLKIILTVPKNRRFIVHSDDVNHIFDPIKSIINSNRRVGVFLDQMIPYINRRNPGLIHETQEDTYKINYYLNLKNTLERFKKRFQLDEIVIALHPEAKTLREEIDKKYSGFRTYENVAHELVKDSTVVFGHFSTVIGFAIYYKKPIILLSDEIIDKTFKKGINSFVNEIKVNVASTDHEFDPQIYNLKVEENLYDEYIRKFMKDSEIKGNSFYFAIKQIEKTGI